jgi:hypothetical protein
VAFVSNIVNFIVMICNQKQQHGPSTKTGKQPPIVLTSPAKLILLEKQTYSERQF